MWVTAFTYFNFVFFVTLVIAGVRDYFFISMWADIFIYIILSFSILLFLATNKNILHRIKMIALKQLSKIKSGARAGSRAGRSRSEVETRSGAERE